MTNVIHIKNAPKNWRNDSNYVYIGRPSIYGNLWSHKKSSIAQYSVSTAEEAVAKYKEYFYDKIEKDEEFRKNIEKLRDKTLICFCKVNGNEPCHGVVIASYLDWETL